MERNGLVILQRSLDLEGYMSYYIGLAIPQMKVQEECWEGFS